MKKNSLKKSLLFPSLILGISIPTFSVVSCSNKIESQKINSNTETTKIINNKSKIIAPILSKEDFEFFHFENDNHEKIIYKNASSLDEHLQIVYSSNEEGIYSKSSNNFNDHDLVYAKFEVKDQYKDQYEIQNNDVEIFYFIDNYTKYSFSIQDKYNGSAMIFIDLKNVQEKIPLSVIAHELFYSYKLWLFNTQVYGQRMDIEIHYETKNNSGTLWAHRFNKIATIEDAKSFFRYSGTNGEHPFNDVIDYNK